MPFYQVRRDVPGASEEEMEAAALRGYMCAMEFGGLRWLQSHWDPEGGVSYCIFEAAGEEEILEHARRARIPCDDVREVRVINPQSFSPAPSTEASALTAAKLVSDAHRG